MDFGFILKLHNRPASTVIEFRYIFANLDMGDMYCQSSWYQSKKVRRWTWALGLCSCFQPCSELIVYKSNTFPTQVVSHIPAQKFRFVQNASRSAQILLDMAPKNASKTLTTITTFRWVPKLLDNVHVLACHLCLGFLYQICTYINEIWVTSPLLSALVCLGLLFFFCG